MTAARATTGRTRTWPLVLALMLHLVVGFVFYFLFATLTIPTPDLYVVWVVWVALLLALAALRRRPWLALAVPFAAAAGLLVATIPGERYWGWGA